MTLGLEGIKVIETASAMAGPLAGRMLGDFGANVIHVERAVRGDIVRSMGRSSAPIRQHGGRLIESDINYLGENISCNKRGMTLDLSKAQSLEILYALLKTADVFLANFRPYELKKFKLDYDSVSRLNPMIIHANMTGYGKKGPDQNLPGYDFNTFWTRSGILRVLQKPGDVPISTPVGMGDRITGLVLAYGIMTALLIRERTGIGQAIDTSLLQAAIFANAHDVGGSLVTGLDRQNVGREELANALLNSYETKDGRWLRIGINQPDAYWSRFCGAIERGDLEHDPRFESFEPRIKNHLALFHILVETFLTRTLAEWSVRLTGAGLPWGPVSTLPEVCADPQARANDFYAAYTHPTFGRMEIVANPVSFSKTPATVRMPSPEYNQHTEEILLEHGFTWADIERFKEHGVIS